MLVKKNYVHCVQRVNTRSSVAADRLILIFPFDAAYMADQPWASGCAVLWHDAVEADAKDGADASVGSLREASHWVFPVDM
jgi:hypothetical protein